MNKNKRNSTTRSASKGTARGTSQGTARSTSKSTARGAPKSTTRGAPKGTARSTPKSTNRGAPKGTSRGTSKGTARSTSKSTNRGTNHGTGTSKNQKNDFLHLLKRQLRRWRRHPGRPLLFLLILAVIIFIIAKGCSGKDDRDTDGQGSGQYSTAGSQTAGGDKDDGQDHNQGQAQGAQDQESQNKGAQNQGAQDQESADPAAVVSEASDPAAVETEEADGLDGFVASSVGVSSHLLWHKVSEADGYLVFRQESSGEGSGQGEHGQGASGQGASGQEASGKDDFRQIADLTGADTLMYDDKDVKMNHSYDYYVSAYQDKDGERQILDSSEIWEVDINWYAQEFKIDDSRSPLYGKKIRYLYYSDDTRIMDPLSVMEKPDKYYIYVNKTACQVVVYAKDKKVFIPVKSFVCSPGEDTPIGTFNTTKKYRWLPLSDDSFGQWSTRIVEHILFHSVMYAEEDNKTLNVEAFNKLGTLCSHGCVRMQAGDAKWIYDNCEIGTRVTIYESDGFEPFEVPAAPVLEADHTWDPSDPEVKKH